MFSFDIFSFYTKVQNRKCSKKLTSKSHDQVMKIRIRPQCERSIQLECRCFQYGIVTIKSYVKKDGGWGP